MIFNISRRHVLTGGAGLAPRGKRAVSVSRPNPPPIRRMAVTLSSTKAWSSSTPLPGSPGRSRSTLDGGFYGRSAFSRITGERL